ncbi:MAG: FAD-dependent oxidoreductase, partial [Methanoregulaceae archaeon]|nr:FAD-dependent oxidoreductase [Methanoregulaceae archaeon]
GGLARTETFDGFSFDHSIHILYSLDPYAQELIRNKLLKDNIHRQVRQSFCFTEGVFTEYPYQTNNFGLPLEVIVENLMGLIEARIAAQKGEKPQHFEEWIYRTFGCGIADHFMVPYNRRLWAWDLKKMSYDWITDRVPVPEIEDVLQGALHPPVKKHGPNQEFWYPVTGGIAALPRAFQRFIPPDRLWLNTTVTAIDGIRREVMLADGRHIRYGRLISTVPLPGLVCLLTESVPSVVQKCARGLKFNTVHTVNIGLDGSALGPIESMHWIYFPEDSTIFHRASIPGNFSPSMIPDGCSSLQLEVSESVHRPCSREPLTGRCLEDLIRIGILKDRDRKRVRIAHTVTLNPAYIIYDLQHRDNIRTISHYLSQLNISSKGRFGEWEYLNMDQAIMSGKRAVEDVP